MRHRKNQSNVTVLTSTLFTKVLLPSEGLKAQLPFLFAGRSFLATP